ncbi:uncharacterized protein TNCV_3180791 [Trichonephila clavipes]|nr:uncharacterized protein TNCV_3180791 [Trichonephila clavipes]
MADLQKSSPKLNSLGGEIFPVPIGLTWEHDILVLKPSPCLHNGNEVDDWMGLDERNSWFKFQVRDSNISKIRKEVELQRAKNKALSLNPAAKVEEKQFKTLNKETATHIGIREAEDWFRPIDLAKECDIYISSRSGSHKEIPITYGYTQDPFKNRSQNFKPKIKENYPQYHERENKKIALYAVIHLITQETVRSVLNLKNLTTTSIIK